MQIDFHLAATYVASRIAGLSHKQAQIVATSAQYVDDATNGGNIVFDNGATYSRICSAHKMIDYRLLDNLNNVKVWTPFHFLPGNGNYPPGENPNGGFINKLICRPNSFVAKDMVTACINSKNKPYGLHRLGVTLHVFVDTWAHQGFAGVSHEVNIAKDICIDDKYDIPFAEKIANYFIGEALPLGHGTVLSYPDRPWLKWSYKNHYGEIIKRDNLVIFKEAFVEMIKVVQQYISEDSKLIAPGIKDHEKDVDLVFSFLETLTDSDGEVRLKSWLEALKKGEFSFGQVDLQYTSKGKGSWKYQALKTIKNTDDDDEVFPWNDEFFTCDWRLFHDAIQSHRFELLYDILPKYGIQAA